jgi:putative ABC transport system permease protein
MEHLGIAMEYIELTYWQVALAALLILVNGAISLALRLGMERTLAWASLRTILQLWLIGWVLGRVFAVDRWYVVLAMLVAMTVVAGIAAGQRNKRRFRGIWFNTIVSLWAASWLVTAYAMIVVVQDTGHWCRPQYVIPLMGMVLGNSLNGTSIGLNSLTDTLVSHRDQVEMALALGASRWEAARAPIQHAVRTGMIPIINSMMVVGIVSLPGMMTGQLLSGTDPIEAVKYQIVIMFLIASATALCTVGVVLLSFYRLFSAEHQFLIRRISG